MDRRVFSFGMMEALEQRRLLSVAPLAMGSDPSAPAQDRYVDPYITLSLGGTRLKKDAVVGFGQVVQGGTSVTKIIRMRDTQGKFPDFVDSDGNSDNGIQPVIDLPTNFSADVSSDMAHGTLTITFTPTVVETVNGTIVIPVNDGPNNEYVIAVNVVATVLPPPAVQVTRIDMAHLPNVVGGDGSKGLAHVQLTNEGALKVHGNATIQLYASSTSTFDAADAMPLGSAEITRSIKPGATQQVSVRFTYPLPPTSGEYYIFAAADGPNLIDPNDTVYLSPIQQPIEQPLIDLAGVPTQTPNFPTNKPTQVAVPLTNTGNVDVHTKVTLRLYLMPPANYPGGSTTLSPIKTVSRNYSVHSGRQSIRMVTLGQSVPAGWGVFAQIVSVELHNHYDAMQQIDYTDTFAIR